MEVAVGESTARQCDKQRVRVAVDGSSLSLTRRPIGVQKGFGPVGSILQKWLGLEVIGALAMSEDGVPISVLAQSWWTRPLAPPRTLKQRKRDRMRKEPREKETARWLEVIERSAQRLEAVGAVGWFQLDREAGAWQLSCLLANNGHWFAVRSAWD